MLRQLAQTIRLQAKLRAGLWLYKRACQLNPAIPLAMLTAAQEHGEGLAHALLQQRALAEHRLQAAQRAARQ